MAIEEHRCKQMPSSGVYISNEVEGFDNHEAWGLHLIREATEEDLEDSHYLENVGDHIWSVVAEISYCPYCGQQLHQRSPEGLREDFRLYASSALRHGLL